MTKVYCLFGGSICEPYLVAIYDNKLLAEFMRDNGKGNKVEEQELIKGMDIVNKIKEFDQLE